MTLAAFILLMLGAKPEELPECVLHDNCEECPYYTQCMKARLEEAEE